MSAPIFLKAQIKDVSFGDHVKIVEPVNLYGCTIGASCFIGPFVEIQSDVTIGQRTKIQSPNKFLIACQVALNLTFAYCATDRQFL